MAATILRTRRSRSGWPCGSRPRCETLAAVNSMAEAFGQAATQAPQPMQAAASMAGSASVFGTGMALASGALPVRTETKPPAAMIASRALAVHHQVLDHGEGLGAPGLDDQRVAVLEAAHVQLAGGRARARPVRPAVHHDAAGAADALAAVVVEGDRLLARERQPLVDHVEHLEEGHVRADVARRVGDEAALVLGVLLPPNVKGQVHLRLQVPREVWGDEVPPEQGSRPRRSVCLAARHSMAVALLERARSVPHRAAHL